MAKAFTKNDFKILTVAFMGLLILWQFIYEEQDTALNHCEFEKLTIEIDRDSNVIKVSQKDHQTFESKILHFHHAGTGLCGVDTFFFEFDGMPMSIGNLGCNSINNIPPDNAKGLVHIGKWENSNPDNYDWSNLYVYPPNDGEFCY